MGEFFKVKSFPMPCPESASTDEIVMSGQRSKECWPLIKFFWIIERPCANEFPAINQHGDAISNSKNLYRLMLFKFLYTY
ncbi:Uncharacterised protein [Enterobacter hormaechei]|nr:Uncharacterised protein [Enterobacter hormaechei]SAC73872.1 Uncharacterised protein [Enterobacter hormaechei]SAD33399.1 Uncharacterised protein [Enterobacter hormaechei]VAK74918.1 Uncharacterised protein [Enterobacter hormaechei]VAL41637.1 Uncharacterised protein [Enterobacter hormaechei]